MSGPENVDVARTGAVRLGPDVVCDGFLSDCSCRVQTHIHDDHTSEFNTSKGVQDVLMSAATRDLLIEKDNADLPYRRNLIPCDMGETREIGSSKVTLLSNDHILGSVQVCVELSNGIRVGYSGDFAWPLDKVIEVDTLIVDSSCGSPSNIRNYSQDQCEEQFASLVRERMRHGPLRLESYHRGTIQRALRILTAVIPDIVFLGTTRLKEEIGVYRKFGYDILPITSIDDEKAKEIIEAGHYVRLYGAADKKPTDTSMNESVFKLSAFFTDSDNPIVKHENNNYGVALSNHADFLGTLEYIRKTGAKCVITDNIRKSRGVELAYEIRDRLGLPARPSANFSVPGWGK